MIVDRLTKSTHFILVKIDYSVDQLAELYVDEIVQFHGVSLSIVSVEICDLHRGSGRNYS